MILLHCLSASPRFPPRNGSKTLFMIHDSGGISNFIVTTVIKSNGDGARKKKFVNNSLKQPWRNVFETNIKRSHFYSRRWPFFVCENVCSSDKKKIVILKENMERYFCKILVVIRLEIGSMTRKEGREKYILQRNINLNMTKKFTVRKKNFVKEIKEKKKRKRN
ncbi:hypothetical protein PUN28_017265 [Cardiocondyla obscurior]|uniref:Uncharacterized protein n=1 Tax=Cardiocondyla obscurior TaxID=286306 RepID=A0AAW2EPZ4_9HYME